MLINSFVGTLPFRLSFGDTDPISGKAVYFLRTIPLNKPIRLDVFSSDDLLFGELLCDSPIDCLNQCVNGVFKPYVNSMLESGVSEPWGSVDVSLRAEFMWHLSKFGSDMCQILDSIAGGIQLKHCPEIDALIAQRAPQPINLVDFFKNSANAQIVKLADCLVGDWIKQIEAFLAATFEVVPLDKENTNPNYIDPGPRTEIEHWKFRVHRITFIAEQLRSLMCRTVLGILHGALIVRSGESIEFELCRPNASLVVKRWRLLDNSVNESLSESRDNLKYLVSLDKYLEPLYSGTPKAVLDNLPAMYNCLKMIHSVARYYSSTKRMTLLLMKITNQVVANCKLFIGNVWDDGGSGKIGSLITRLNVCLDLVATYQSEYQKTSAELGAVSESSPPFAFNLITVFGKLDFFVRRLKKLIDMFALVGQFDEFNIHKFDGMEAIVTAFNQLKDEFRNKRHDLLDFYVRVCVNECIFVCDIGESV